MRPVSANVALLSLTSPSSIVGIGLVCYLAVCRALRWKRYNAIHQRYSHKWDSKKNVMRPGQELTPEEAQEITLIGVLYDMPMVLNYSVAFALFKTYGIPSISSLLLKTKELGSETLVAKRYLDTGILISTWATCPIAGFFPSKPEPGLGGKSPPDGWNVPAPDPRAMIALARTNWLHSKYNISNDDYLYTLSLFIIEPIDWSSKFGWRALSGLEQHAIFVFWFEIGRRMNIKDVPETLEELKAWSKAYEMTYMVPAESNHAIALLTTEEMLFGVPDVLGIKTLLKKFTVCLLEDRVREAMMYQPQPRILRYLINAALLVFAFIHRHLCLPRIHPENIIDLKAGPEDACPFAFPTRYTSRPWYKSEPKGLEYCRSKIMVWLGLYAEMPGEKLKAGGYRLETLGPLSFENSGREEVIRMAEEMQGFPVAGPWAGFKDPCAKQFLSQRKRLTRNR